MAIQNSLERAEMLFDMEEYGKAFNMAMDILKEDSAQDTCKLWTLAAKSYLYLTVEVNDDRQERFEKAAALAFSAAQTAEEELWVEQQLRSAIADWAPKAAMHAASILSQEPTKENRDRYLGNLNISQYSLYDLSCKSGMCVMLHSTYDNPQSTRLAKMKEEERAELYMKVCGVSELSKLNLDELRIIGLDTAKQIMENVHSKMNEHAHGSMEYIKMVAPIIVAALFTVRFIYINIRCDEDIEKNPELAQEIYLNELAFLGYSMDAMFYPNGKAQSVLYTEDERKYFLDRWYEVESYLKEISPNFDAGKAPSTTGVDEYNAGGCYVATAVYGSYDCPQVWTLRRFRDNTLASTWYGRAFIRTYYAISPTLVKWFGHTAWFKNMWRSKLDRMVEALQKQGVDSTPYQDRNW